TDAITTLRALLDTRVVRFEFHERDKNPNSDGYILLVDADRPRGKIEVQIKTLRPGAASIRCSTSLVAYTREVTTLPFILIGVDAVTSRAYWTEISETMVGYRANQKTFTVHFTPAVDAIDHAESCPCYHRWLELAKEFRERIRRYRLVAPDNTRRSS